MFIYNRQATISSPTERGGATQEAFAERGPADRAYRRSALITFS
jgi:hypothetical protein